MDAGARRKPVSTSKRDTPGRQASRQRTQGNNPKKQVDKRNRGTGSEARRMRPRCALAAPRPRAPPLYSVTLRALKTSLKKTWRKLNAPFAYPHRRGSAWLNGVIISNFS